MNKAELVAALAARLGQSKAAAASVLDAVLVTITETVAAGDRVSLTGFGTFERTHRAARTIRNPATGQPMETSDRYATTFRAGSRLREAANEGVGASASARAAASSARSQARPAKASTAAAKAAPQQSPARAAKVPSSKAPAAKAAAAAPLDPAPVTATTLVADAPAAAPAMDARDQGKKAKGGAKKDQREKSKKPKKDKGKKSAKGGDKKSKKGKK